MEGRKGRVKERTDQDRDARTGAERHREVTQETDRDRAILKEEKIMVSIKRDIKCADFEARIKKAIKEVDEMKHATPQAKKEVYDLLMNIRDDLVKWDVFSIEIPEFMRETR